MRATHMPRTMAPGRWMVATNLGMLRDSLMRVQALMHGGTCNHLLHLPPEGLPTAVLIRSRGERRRREEADKCDIVLYTV